jgi:hypothetical protein
MILRNVGTHKQDCTQPERPVRITVFTDIRLSRWLFIDADSAVGSLHCLWPLSDAVSMETKASDGGLKLVISRHFPGGPNENGGNLKQDSIRPRFEPRTCDTRDVCISPFSGTCDTPC